MSFSKKQYLLIAVAIASAIILYLLPTKDSSSSSESESPGAARVSDIPENQLLQEADSLRDAFESEPDSSKRPQQAARAIELYQKVVQKNPSNLDAKAGLGLCYAEASPDPMKGIMLLREVVTANPNHENAQLFLGFLSVKSGQYQKAVERFETVKKINSENINVLLYLGEAYLQTGNKQKALENLQEFQARTKDESLSAQVGEMIKKAQ